MNDETNKPGEFSGSLTLTGYGPHIRIEDVTSYIHRAEEGGYWAEVPALPGCLIQGETLDEVVDYLNHAIAGWLSVQTLDSLTAISRRMAAQRFRPNSQQPGLENRNARGPPQANRLDGSDL